MTVVREQTAKGGWAGTSSVTLATAAFTNPVTAGRAMVVFVRLGSTTTTINSVTDTGSNSYSQKAISSSADPTMAVYLATGITGGSSFVVQANLDGAPSFSWIYAFECSGASYDLAGVKNGTAATDLTTNSFSTSRDGAVFVAASQPALATYSAGVDFTFIENATFEGNDFGGLEERYPTGALSSYTAHMTSNTSEVYTIAWISLVASAVTPDPFDFSYFPKIKINSLLTGTEAG